MKSCTIQLLFFSIILCLSSAFAVNHIPSRNLDPNYQPVTFSDYQATHPESETAIREISVSTNRDFSNFLIIVDSDLYPEVNQSILTYQENLEQDEINAFLLTFSGTRCSDLRNLLAAYYQSYNIMGAMLVGDLPLAWYELFEDWNHSGEQDNGEGWAEFPMDIYYTDLDGEWIDSNENGIYDDHSGNTEPEIILGRIKADNLDLLQQTEAELVNNYFAKNNQFRQGLIETNDTALLYLDDDWQNQFDDTMEDLAYSFEEVVLVNESQTTCAGDYAEELTHSYDLIQVNVHSNPFYHQFSPPPNFTNQNLVSSTPNALFYNLFACSNANLAAPNNMGSIYLLDNDYTQVVLGSTKSGGILYTEEIYRPIIFGSSIGKNLKDWWIEHVDTGTDTTWQRTWFYGLTLLGDPCFELKNQSATIVSGEVEGVWTANNSPYIMLDDITIPAGSILEIEAGCKIVAVGQDAFVVNGSLTAIGTEVNPIKFTSLLMDQPWKGIYFENSPSDVAGRMEHCVVTNSRKRNYPGTSGGGICVDNSNVVIINSTVKNCIASTYGGGIAVINNSEVTIQNCTFIHNSAKYGGGIANLSMNSVLDNCKVISNEANLGGGIYSDSPISLIASSIRCNTAEDLGGGIYLEQQGALLTDGSTSIYNNFSILGRDIASDWSTPSFTTILDTFSVQYPTEYFAHPLTNFEITAQNFLINQTNEDLYVSPQGNNNNSGLTPDQPLLNISEALIQLMPADLENIQTINLAPGLYSVVTTQEAFPITMAEEVVIKGTGIDETIVYPSNENYNRSFDATKYTNVCLKDLTIKRDEDNIVNHPELYERDDLKFNNCKVDIENVKFIVAGEHVAAIHCDSCEVEVENIQYETSENGSNDGTYFIFLNSDVSLINSHFKDMPSGFPLLGFSWSSCTLDNLNFTAVSRAISFNESEFEASNIIIKDFDVSQTEYNGSRLIRINNSTGTLQNTNIINNLGHYGALFINNASGPVTIKDCVIRNNYTEVHPTILVSDSDQLFFENVTIKNNSSIGYSNFKIWNSTINFSPENKCNIYDNDSNINGAEFLTDCYVNLVVDTFSVAIPTSSECFPLEMFSFNIQSEYPEYNEVDLYVSTTGNDSNLGISPESPLQTISHALSQIDPSPDNILTIHLAPGIYNNSNNEFPILGKNYVKIVGDNPDNTFLISDEIPALSLYNKNNFEMKNLTITVNSSENACTSEYSSFKLSNIDFLNCSTTGSLFYMFNCEVEYENVRWFNNIMGNQGVVEARHSDIILNKCTIANNQVVLTGGGISLYYTQMNANNSSFLGNRANFGKSIYIDNSEVDLTNCNISGIDILTGFQTEIFLKNSDIKLRNNIFFPIYGDVALLYESSSEDSINIDYCLLESGISSINHGSTSLFYGDMNISGDPLFIDESMQNFVLLPTSPCIDNGDPEICCDIEDPANPGFALWPSLGTVAPDMGIYGGSYVAYREQGNLIIEDVPEFQKNILSNYPNPFNPSTTISFSSEQYEQDEEIKIEIYNIKGQRIRELAVISTEAIHGEMERSQATTQSVTWNARDNQGKQVSSGVYMYCLKVGNKIKASRKMLLLK